MKSRGAPLDVNGPAAPPRKNGELVFAAPWESRVFGLTMALHSGGVFEWEEFRDLLIDEIGRWETRGHPPESWSYYARWSEALRRLLTAKGLIANEELLERAAELAARPAGHDH